MEDTQKPIPEWANRSGALRLVYKTFRMLKNEGLKQTLFAIKYVIKRAIGLRSIKRAMLVPDMRLTGEQLKYAPKISVIVPLYNTPEVFLRDLIKSYQGQSYKNRQLCLADGSDGDHPEVGRICLEYAKSDPTIVYKKLEKNLGISGNTNAAIELADGDYIALLDHDDMLVWSALYEAARAAVEQGADFIYSDEALFTKKPSDCVTMHLKPDYSPDFLRGCNYICHLSVIKRSLALEVGLYDSAYDGSQDYDFTLRVCERAEKIYHIAKPLYLWRIHEGSVASGIGAKSYAYDAARRAVQAHLDRTGLKGKVVFSHAVPMVRPIYEIAGEPLVSVIIPTCDHADDLTKCVNSLLERCSYKNFEIILCENNSRERETFENYDRLVKRDPRIKLVTWDGEFNYSAINNYARGFASGEHLLFLNNDTEVITERFFEEMLMFTQRPDVAACGVKLLYPDDMVQHGGIVVGVFDCAANICPMFPRDNDGYLCRLAIASNMSACTAACLMVKASVFDEVGGFSESFAVSFNDVDLCLKMRKRGYLIVFNPECEAYHYESRSRGYDDKGEKKKRMEREKKLLRDTWPEYFEPLGYDPYYNPNFGRYSRSYDA